MIPTFTVGGLGNTRMVTAAAAYSAEAAQFFARLSVVPTTPRKDLYAACIDALVTAGVWAKLDALYLCVSEDNADTDTALTNLKQASFKATLVSTPGFTATGGFASDASTKYVSTNFIPSTAGGNYAQNSASMFSWGTQSTFDGTSAPSIETTGDNAFSYIYTFSPNLSYSELNDAADGSGGGISGPDGLLLMSRNSPTEFVFYRNGVSQYTEPTNSVGLPNGVCIFGADPANNQYYYGAILCAGVGGGLDATEQLALYNAVHTFLQSAAGVA